MTFGTAEVVVALFFLTGLLFVARLRRRLRVVDKASYNYMAAGLSMLALVSLSEILFQAGLYLDVPLFRQQPFYHLISSIVVITGLVCLVFGVSNWLPLERAHRKYSRARMQRLLFLKRIAQLFGIETRTPRLLKLALGYMVEHYELSQGAVFVCRRSDQTLRFLAGDGPRRMSDATYREVDFSQALISDTDLDRRHAERHLVGALPDGAVRPNLVLPVVVDGRLAAVFLLWQGRNIEWDAEDANNLRLACDMIATRITTATTAARNDLFLRQKELAIQAEKAIDNHRDLKDNLARLAPIVRESVPFEYFTLSIFTDSLNIQRLALGTTGSVLNEVGTRLRDGDALLSEVRESRSPRLYRDLSAQPHPELDTVLINNHMQSLMAVPIMHGRQVLAVAMWSSRVPGRYARPQLELINGLLPLLGRLVMEENSRAETERTDRRASLVQSLLENLGQCVSADEMLQTTAHALQEELKTTMVRISTYDAEEGFVRSRALASMRSEKETAPADGWMIRSLAPYHELVHESGRPMVVNQDEQESRMTEAEANQFFGPGLKSAVLVPVRTGTNVYGVISCGEKRNTGRYQYRQQEIMLVNLFASVLGSMLTLQVASDSPGQVTSRRRVVEGGFGLETDARMRIKSSLTGILGSIEMIQSAGPDRQEFLDRYLSIIDRSARRINECVADESTVQEMHPA